MLNPFWVEFVTKLLYFIILYNNNKSNDQTLSLSLTPQVTYEYIINLT